MFGQRSVVVVVVVVVLKRRGGRSARVGGEPEAWGGGGVYLEGDGVGEDGNDARGEHGGPPAVGLDPARHPNRRTAHLPQANGPRRTWAWRLLCV